MCVAIQITKGWVRDQRGGKELSVKGKFSTVLWRDKGEARLGGLNGEDDGKVVKGGMGRDN